jgi:hypothetical protein
MSRLKPGTPPPQPRAETTLSGIVSRALRNLQAMSAGAKAATQKISSKYLFSLVFSNRPRLAFKADFS